MTIIGAAIDSEQQLARATQQERRRIMDEQKRKQQALEGAQPKQIVQLPHAKRG